MGEVMIPAGFYELLAMFVGVTATIAGLLSLLALFKRIAR